MPKNINLKGTTGKKYDLDKLSEDTRTNSGSELLVQIWQWCPDLPDTTGVLKDHREPNPPSPKIGQLWLSKLVKRFESDGKTETEEYRALLASLTKEG